MEIKIESKFNLGDKVFAINGNHKIVEFVITRIFAFIKEDKTDLMYGNEAFDSFEEDICFSTKADIYKYMEK